MANIAKSSEYKNKIISLLLSDEDFVKFINPKEPPTDELDTVDMLLGGEWIIDGEVYKEQGHIFDYDFVDDTITDEKNFMFVETTITNITDSFFIDFDLYICVFSAKNLVRLDDSSVPTAKEAKAMGYISTSTRGNRIDILCDIIDKRINGSDKFTGLGHIQPVARDYMKIYTPNKSYYGKCLHYYITNYNSGGDVCDNQ